MTEVQDANGSQIKSLGMLLQWLQAMKPAHNWLILRELLGQPVCSLVDPLSRQAVAGDNLPRPVFNVIKAHGLGDLDR